VTALSDALKEYVALRRALGAHFVTDEAVLRRFVRFAEREGADVVTTDLALRWATALGRASARTRALRLGVVRRFAAWLSATEPRTGVPPAGLLPGGLVRRAPYVYSDEEIVRIVEESSRLRSPAGLRALTFATLFGLLAVTGMRLSEALGLDLDDVDLRGGVLTVRRAKFGKSRFVPLHESTCAALRRYARRRDRLSACAASPAFFVNERGARVRGSCAEQTFAVVSRAVGLRPPAERRDYRGHGPRLHDMRHRLVVRTLVRWYREGRDVERELPKIVAYLGHAHVAYTYWYFEAVPELLHLAGERAALRPETSP
jgi:integrase/recombinase XerD